MENDGCDLSALDSEDVHVLAVDDSIVDRKVIERLLRISSCKVTSVDSVRGALQFLGLDEENCKSDFDDTSKVDLIITDYCMPEMTGYDLLKKIKESSTLKQIPVVIMSSENVMARINRCLEEGAEDFIVKPVKLDDVKRIRDCTIMRELREKNQLTGIYKSKLQETCDEPSSSPASISSSSTLSSLSVSSSPSLSPPPLSSSSAPSSPLSLDSPPRRLRMSP